MAVDAAPTGAYEQLLHAQGFRHVAGADEAGRGALAGPLVAAAVMLPPGWAPDGLNDSKLVSPTDRERLYDEIVAGAVAVGIFRVSHTRLDGIGLQRANLAALRAALNKLDPTPDYVLVDGFTLARTSVPALRVVKGDQVCTSVAAASIVAKVTRDRIMVRAERRYPGYGFASHKGYRSPEHLAALARLGPCEFHRRCFAPVAAAHGGPTIDGLDRADLQDPDSDENLPHRDGTERR